MRAVWRTFRERPWAAVLVAGLVSAVAFLAQAVVERAWQAFDQGTASMDSWLAVPLFLIFIMVIALLVILKSSVDELTRRAGLSVKYYRLNPSDSTKERGDQAQLLYSAARRVIESAKENGGSKILAVNSFVEIGDQVGDDRVQRESRRYLEAINGKIGKVHYHRILQLADADLDKLPSASIKHLIADNYLAHYKKMVTDGRKVNGDEVTLLEAVLAKYPTSFVIVQNPEDGPYGGKLIWQMHQHVADETRTDKVDLTGIYIVVDPDGVMVGTFIRWFRDLVSADRRRQQLSMVNLANGATAGLDGGAADQPPSQRKWRPWERRVN